jgi:hypothetical protein
MDMLIQKPGFIKRFVGTLKKVGAWVGVVESPVLHNVEFRLRDVLQKFPTIRLNSFMYIDLSEIPRDVSQYWADCVTAVLREEFGTNQNFVRAVVNVLRDSPLIVEPALSKIDKLFSFAEQKRYDPRRLVPVIYLCIVRQRDIEVPQDSSYLFSVLDEACKILAEGKDPIEELGLSVYLKNFVKERCPR